MPVHAHAQFHRRQSNPLDQIGAGVNSLVNGAINGAEGAANAVRSVINGDVDGSTDSGSANSNSNDKQDAGSNNNGDGGNNAATVVSIVYVTASATFSGPIMGYTTLDHPEASSANAVPQQQTSASSPQSNQAVPTSNSQAQSSAAASTASLIDTISTSPASLSQATGSASSANNADAGSTSPTSTASPSSKGGLSGGAKAGIAIGVLLGIAALVGIAFVLYRRRQQQENAGHAALEEKSNPFADNMGSSGARAAISPPMVQSQGPFGHATNANMMAGTAVAGAAVGAGAGYMATRAAPSPPQSPAYENPFGPHAELPANSSAPGTSAGPFTDKAATEAEADTAATSRRPLPESLRVSRPVMNAEAAALAAAAGAAAGIAIGGAAAYEKKSPQSEGSPSPTESTSSAAAAAEAEDEKEKEKVHRVQLDFKPSMDDELELKVGQLVRIIHEYDDGWALCSRLDKSQQGVAPRTCLSARPLKPRPPQAPRPPPLARPDSPAGSVRSLTNGPGPRGPLTPGMRSQPGSPAIGGPGMRNGPPRAGSPGPGMMNGPPRNMSPGPGMMNGPPRVGSPGPGMRNGPPRAGSPGPYSPQMPPANRSRGNSAAGAQQRPRPGPQQSSALGPNRLSADSMDDSSKISRKPVGEQSP